MTTSLKIPSLALVIGLLAVTAVSAAPGALDQWQWRFPNPQGNDLHHAIFGRSSWVAVGDQGTILNSTDGGDSWRTQYLGGYALKHLAFGNGVFVAIGRTDDEAQFPQLFTSGDGFNWTNRTGELSSTWPLLDIAFGNGLFLVVNGNREVGRSVDGWNWTWHFTSFNAPYQFESGGDRFLGCDGGAVTTPTGLVARVAISTNGLDWQSKWIPVPGWCSTVGAGGGQFVLAGAQWNLAGFYEIFTMTSTDGDDWATHVTSQSNWPSALQYGAGKWVMLRDDPESPVLTSPNAIYWTAQSLPLTNHLEFAAFGNGSFLTGGRLGNLLTSVDGVSWKPRSSGNPAILRNIVHGEGISITVGDRGTLLTSPDGLTWTPGIMPTTENLHGATYGWGRFVVFGDSGAVLTSTNGLNWIEEAAGNSTGCQGLAFSGQCFVGVGYGGTVLRSEDGVSWTDVARVTTQSLRAVTWTGAQFVAVGDNGTFLHSPNGEIWTMGSTTDGQQPAMRGVAASSNLLVSVGANGAIYASDTGDEWTRNTAAAALLASSDLTSVSFAAGQFIAVGLRGVVATSTDGVLWRKRSASCGRDLFASAYCDGRVIVVGDGDSVLQSGFFGPPILRVGSLIPGVGFTFFAEVEADRPARLQTTSDLLHWQDLYNFTGTGEPTGIMDSGVEFNERLFYRVLLP